MDTVWHTDLFFAKKEVKHKKLRSSSTTQKKGICTHIVAVDRNVTIGFIMVYNPRKPIASDKGKLQFQFLSVLNYCDLIIIFSLSCLIHLDLRRQICANNSHL